MGHRVQAIGFVGAGRVATALAVGLAGAGYRVAATWSRTPESAERLAAALRESARPRDGSGHAPAPPLQVCESAQDLADRCDLVFITTPDDAIANVALSVQWRPGQSVVHCSGALSVEALATARRAGALTGGFHPLQTFAGDGAPADERLKGATFGIEADGPLRGLLQQMAEALGARWLVVPTGAKARYHLAGVLASNYVVTLAQAGIDCLEAMGVPESEARAALAALLRGTVSNVERLGAPAALTGPIARGDAGTVQRHLRELERGMPGVAEAYRALGRLTVPLALARGTIDRVAAERLLALLSTNPLPQPGEPREALQEVRA